MKKNSWVAIIIAGVLPGIGHFYLGKFERGLLITTSYWAVFIVTVVTGIFDGLDLNQNLNQAGNLFYFMAYTKRFFMAGITGTIIYVWQIFDAYKLAKKTSTK